jgi:hypothetical protein
MKLNTYPGFGFQKLTESARTMPLFYLLPTMKRQEPKLIDAQDPRSRMVQESHDRFLWPGQRSRDIDLAYETSPLRSLSNYRRDRSCSRTAACLFSQPRRTGTGDLHTQELEGQSGRIQSPGDCAAARTGRRQPGTARARRFLPGHRTVLLLRKKVPPLRDRHVGATRLQRRGKPNPVCAGVYRRYVGAARSGHQR